MPPFSPQHLLELLRAYQAPQQQPPPVPGDWQGIPEPPVPQAVPGNVDPRLYNMPVAPGSGAAGSNMPYAGTVDPTRGWRRKI